MTVFVPFVLKFIAGPSYSLDLAFLNQTARRARATYVETEVINGRKTPVSGLHNIMHFQTLNRIGTIGEMKG